MKLPLTVSLFNGKHAQVMKPNQQVDMTIPGEVSCQQFVRSAGW